MMKVGSLLIHSLQHITIFNCATSKISVKSRCSDKVFNVTVANADIGSLKYQL